MTTLCAWCLSEQGLDMGSGSHGICERHAAKVLQQQRDRKLARAAKQNDKQVKVAA